MRNKRQCRLPVLIHHQSPPRGAQPEKKHNRRRSCVDRNASSDQQKSLQRKVPSLIAQACKRALTPARTTNIACHHAVLDLLSPTTLQRSKHVGARKKNSSYLGLQVIWRSGQAAESLAAQLARRILRPHHAAHHVTVSTLQNRSKITISSSGPFPD